MTSSSTNTETPWHGNTAVTIAFGTDPWLRDEAGHDVNLAASLTASENAANNSCPACVGSTVAGVLAPMNSEYGVQACDECQVFTSDLDAARALADTLGPGLTVWFESEPS